MRSRRWLYLPILIALLAFRAYRAVHTPAPGPAASPGQPPAASDSNQPSQPSPSNQSGALEPQASYSNAGKNVPVPTSCTPAVNQKLEQMIQANRSGYTENVMVCGTATGTTVNHGGEHGSHHLITVSANLPGSGTRFVQIAINDTLDGVVSARPGQSVFAFGQGYVTGGKWVAGVHDVHCSTHPAADNGWVVVDGTKTPTSCPSR